MRYNPILTAKIEEEKKESLKQEKLKEKNGIEDENVIVKKRTGRHLLHEILMGILYIIRLLLAAVGVLVLIDPTLREAFFYAIQSFIK